MGNFKRSFIKKIAQSHGEPKPKPEKRKPPKTLEEEIEYNKQVKANKKGAKGIYRNLLYFASIWEADYWDQIVAEYKAGMYKAIRRQVRIPIKINGVLIATYVADVVIYHHDGRTEVRDTKSEFTKKDPVYQIKRKLVAVLYGIYIVEVLRTRKKS